MMVRFLLSLAISLMTVLWSPISHATLLTAPLESNAANMAKVDLVRVDKSKRRMYLLENNHIVKSYRIALGKAPKGHKEREGDQRTPEGRYYLGHVSNDSSFYRSMHVSYPNQRDIEHAKQLHVEPGGNIKIHGMKNAETLSASYLQSFDWTNGCIALSNEEMDEFLALVKPGTPIDIEW